MWSKDITGRVLPFNEVNERYVALKKVNALMEMGLSDEQIAWVWNSGRHDTCVYGINKNNIHYNSCEYGKKVLREIARH